MFEKHYSHMKHLSKWRFVIVVFAEWIGRLRFHYDNEYKNDNEISLSFSKRFCTQRDERLIDSISSSSTTITNSNTGRTQEMMMSAHNNFVLVVVVVVKS